MTKEEEFKILFTCQQDGCEKLSNYAYSYCDEHIDEATRKAWSCQLDGCEEQLCYSFSFCGEHSFKWVT